jgi:PAS domain S-box-containing protein
MNNSHDLFLLMFNLSQMRDKGIIVVHFQDCISEIFHPFKFTFTEQKPGGNKYSEEITTRNLSFGYISSHKKPTDEVRKLLQNAIQMLAFILDRLSFENALIARADSLEAVAKQHLSDINTQIEELQNAKFASLNLIEDLKQEIVQRKKVEESLRLKNFVFNDSIAANSIADINGIIHEVNNSFLKMWGYTDIGEVNGKPITHFLNDEADGLPIITALQGSGEWEGDYTARRKDGSVFIAHGLATLIKDETGKSVGYQSAVLDFTEKRNQEELIRQLNEELEAKVLQRTEQLEAANKELEAFSYSVSHDLRAPLRHISGFIDLLNKRNSAQLDSEGLRFLNLITESTHEMGNLIDALLAFSRLSRSELHRVKIDSKSIVNRVLKTFSDELTGRTVEINISELPEILGDEDLINQVWVNLISNALKYSGKVEKAVIDIGGKTVNGDTIFHIKDNGAGFDMKYADKLFGVFQRLHKARDFEGVGIGLANVNRIVMRHGGKCWAESEVGKGATFLFSLPNN